MDFFYIHTHYFCAYMSKLLCGTRTSPVRTACTQHVEQPTEEVSLAILKSESRPRIRKAIMCNPSYTLNPLLLLSPSCLNSCSTYSSQTYHTVQASTVLFLFLQATIHMCHLSKRALIDCFADSFTKP